jgi:hypothetical protein
MIFKIIFNLNFKGMSNTKYLKLLQYPLKLENVINDVNYNNYVPFCDNIEGPPIYYMQSEHYHKSLLLYLICKGYPFEQIVSEQKVGYGKLVASCICKNGEFYKLNITRTKTFEPISELYDTHYFIEDKKLCVKLRDDCLDDMHDVAQKILYSMAKELLYKHYILYCTDCFLFDTILYTLNIFLQLLK